MTSRQSPHTAAERALRERMAESRAILITAREAARLRTASGMPSLPTRVREIVSTAPHVMLLLALLAGSIVIGPRRVVSMVVRNGLAAWISKNVRRIAGR